MNATSAIKAEFHYSNDVTIKDIISIEKKSQTVRKNLPFDTTMNIFHTRNIIEVIFTHDADTSRREDAQARTVFNRFINTHKEPATYGWSTASQLVSN